jgi:tetratricopeptide (TPR) repeat protein
VYIENPTYLCWAAPTYEKTGQHAKADAALDAPAKYLGIATFTDCYRFRADVLELRGDWRAAEAWYQKGEALGPSIPTTYYSYGIALAKHGDLTRAAEQFKLATDKGPHWADPLKAWGDLLAQQQKPKEALQKYDAALKFAPEWPALKAARATLAAAR